MDFEQIIDLGSVDFQGEMYSMFVEKVQPPATSPLVAIYRFTVKDGSGVPIVSYDEQIDRSDTRTWDIVLKSAEYQLDQKLATWWSNNRIPRMLRDIESNITRIHLALSTEFIEVAITPVA